MENLRLDRDERYEDMEWQSIMAGSFSNPEMATKAIEEKRRIALGGDPIDTLDEQVQKTATQRMNHGVPEPDSSVQERILGGADDIKSLSEIAEEYEEDA